MNRRPLSLLSSVGLALLVACSNGPRGTPDSDPPETYLRSVAFRAPGNENVLLRWPDDRMPLRIFLDRPPAGLFENPEAIHEAVRRGVLDWTDAARPGLPRFEFAETIGDADIPIVWAETPDGDWQVAHCAWDIHLLMRRFGVSRILVTGRWSGGQPAEVADVYRMALHEVGHALGLGGHSPDPTDVMYESVAGSITGPSARDRATLAALYARPIGARMVGARPDLKATAAQGELLEALSRSAPAAPALARIGQGRLGGAAASARIPGAMSPFWPTPGRVSFDSSTTPQSPWHDDGRTLSMEEDLSATAAELRRDPMKDHDVTRISPPLFILLYPFRVRASECCSRSPSSCPSRSFRRAAKRRPPRDRGAANAAPVTVRSACKALQPARAARRRRMTEHRSILASSRRCYETTRYSTSMISPSSQVPRRPGGCEAGTTSGARSTPAVAAVSVRTRRERRGRSPSWWMPTPNTNPTSAARGPTRNSPDAAPSW